MEHLEYILHRLFLYPPVIQNRSVSFAAGKDDRTGFRPTLRGKLEGLLHLEFDPLPEGMALWSRIGKGDPDERGACLPKPISRS